MPITRESLEDIFSYHPPTENWELENYATIRDAALKFAKVILDCTPPSPDQTAAIRKIREAVMTANASIALKGRY